MTVLLCGHENSASKVTLVITTVITGNRVKQQKTAERTKPQQL